MIVKTLAFLAGVLALQFIPELPPWYSYPAVLAAVCSLRWRVAWLPALWVLGFFWAAFHAQMALLPLLDSTLEGQTVLVEGTVVALPERVSNQSLRFLFQADTLNAGNHWQDFDGRIRLSWYRTRQRPQLGDRWQLAVRLKRPHGYANPGGFDYERWLFQQRIRATGYVRKDERNRHLDGQSLSLVAGIRNNIATRYQAMGSTSPGLALIRALTIGDRSAIDPGQWDILRATGTSHLIAISGLHISLVAGLVFGVMRRAWSRLGALPEIIPASKAAAVLALLAALFYALLAGLSIPTRRALIMLGVAMMAVLAGRQSRPGHVLCLAVIAILLIDPLSVLSPGWWLSFWAVTLIVYITTGRYGREGLWRKWTWVHLVLAVSLMPVLLVFFQQASLIAPLANVVAVPWVGLLVVPVSLIGALLLSISTTAGTLLLNLAAWLMEAIWPYLEWLGGLDIAVLQQHQPLKWTLLPATAGILLLFAPRGIPGKWAGIVLLLPLFTAKPPLPAPGEAQVTLLDVGQGLSTVVRTRNHTLVYDAGPSYSPTFDTGQSVVVPFLRSQGVRQVEKLVVSHGDNDHIGGVASLLKHLPVNHLTAGVPEAIQTRTATRCRRGDRWWWDGVKFSVMHPEGTGRREGNNASCVIRIEAGGGQRVLLTGDIESASEQALLRDLQEQLRAEVVIAPHHGSLTSSSRTFVGAVNPDYALFPVGYRNRYHFPKEEVVGRYRAAGAEIYNTARHGAITLRLPADDRAIDIASWRCANPRFWRQPNNRFGWCDK